MSLPSGNDYDLDAALAGLSFRQELNTILSAILTQSSSASLPPLTFPFMNRADTGATPNELQIRNPSDNAFLKWAEITDTAISLFSGGAPVPSLGVAQTFTEDQTVDRSGSTGQVIIGSDLTTGVVARIPLFGHNSSGANTTGVNLICRMDNNTAGSEDFNFEIEVVRGGVANTIATFGGVAIISGALNAVTLQQNGVNLDTIINDALSKVPARGNFSGPLTVAQADAGGYRRYNGTGNQTITLPRLSEGSIVQFINDSGGSGDLSFVSAASPNDVEIRTTKTTLPGVSGQSPTCMIQWILSGGNRVTINGENV